MNGTRCKLIAQSIRPSVGVFAIAMTGAPSSSSTVDTNNREPSMDSQRPDLFTASLCSFFSCIPSLSFSSSIYSHLDPVIPSSRRLLSPLALLCLASRCHYPSFLCSQFSRSFSSLSLSTFVMFVPIPLPSFFPLFFFFPFFIFLLLPSSVCSVGSQSRVALSQLSGRYRFALAVLSEDGRFATTKGLLILPRRCLSVRFPLLCPLAPLPSPHLVARFLLR